MNNKNNLCIKIENNDQDTLFPNLFLTDEQINNMHPRDIGKGIYKDVLGSGSFGVVYKTRINEDSNLFRLVKIRELLNIDIAIKKIKGKNFNFNEIKLLMKTQHLKYSCKYYFCLISNSDVYIIMEYIKGMELLDYQNKIRVKNPGLFRSIIQGMSNDEINQYLNTVKIIIMQVASAIEELHRNKLYHNDIKLENIMVITEPNGDLKIKLFDYGLACDFNEDIQKQSQCNIKHGTPGYIIKEFNKNNKISNKNYEKKIAKKDWWAFGFMLFNLLFNYFIDDEGIDLEYITYQINILNNINTNDSRIFYNLLTYLIINKQKTILNHSVSVNAIQQEIFRILGIINDSTHIEKETKRRNSIKNNEGPFGFKHNGEIYDFGNSYGGGWKKNNPLSKSKSKLKSKIKLKIKLKSKSKLNTRK
jgi:serine/threonine protein kinase